MKEKKQTKLKKPTDRRSGHCIDKDMNLQNLQLTVIILFKKLQIHAQNLGKEAEIKNNPTEVLELRNTQWEILLKSWKKKRDKKIPNCLKIKTFI